jgi:vacuolar-type H+-ATPase subunit H
MQPTDRICTRCALLAALLLTVGCHSNKTPPTTAQDVEAAKEDAQRQVAQARIEAAKDVKSAAKTSGNNPKDVAYAQMIAAYDLAMVKAEGDHTVAIQNCQTLQPAQIQACKDHADADYESAKAKAKAARTAHQ